MFDVKKCALVLVCGMNLVVFNLYPILPILQNIPICLGGTAIGSCIFARLAQEGRKSNAVNYGKEANEHLLKDSTDLLENAHIIMPSGALSLLIGYKMSSKGFFKKMGSIGKIGVQSPVYAVLFAVGYTMKLYSIETNALYRREAQASENKAMHEQFDVISEKGDKI
jgi:hypothetical protein